VDAARVATLSWSTVTGTTITPEVKQFQGFAQHLPAGARGKIRCTISRCQASRPRGMSFWLSAPGLCTACDERLLPELESLLAVWRQFGGIAMAYRSP
jgi:hypothetical protein